MYSTFFSVPPCVPSRFNLLGLHICTYVHPFNSDPRQYDAKQSRSTGCSPTWNTMRDSCLNGRGLSPGTSTGIEQTHSTTFRWKALRSIGTLCVPTPTTHLWLLLAIRTAYSFESDVELGDRSIINYHGNLWSQHTQSQSVGCHGFGMRRSKARSYGILRQQRVGMFSSLLRSAPINGFQFP